MKPVQKYIKERKNREKKTQDIPLYSGPVKMLAIPPSERAVRKSF